MSDSAWIEGKPRRLQATFHLVVSAIPLQACYLAGFLFPKFALTLTDAYYVAAISLILNAVIALAWFIWGPTAIAIAPWGLRVRFRYGVSNIPWEQFQRAKNRGWGPTYNVLGAIVLPHIRPGAQGVLGLELTPTQLQVLAASPLVPMRPRLVEMLAQRGLSPG